MVTMMLYILASCGLRILSLVGLVVRGCSKIIQIYTCKLIVGDKLLTALSYSDLFLLAVVICTKIGGGRFHIRCTILQ